MEADEKLARFCGVALLEPKARGKYFSEGKNVWSETDKAILLHHQDDIDTAAEILGRSRAACISMKSRLLKHDDPLHTRQYVKWTPELLAQVAQLCETHTYAEVADMLGMTQSSIKSQMGDYRRANANTK